MCVIQLTCRLIKCKFISPSVFFHLSFREFTIYHVSHDTSLFPDQPWVRLWQLHSDAVSPPLDVLCNVPFREIQDRLLCSLDGYGDQAPLLLLSYRHHVATARIHPDLKLIVHLLFLKLWHSGPLLWGWLQWRSWSSFSVQHSVSSVLWHKDPPPSGVSLLEHETELDMAAMLSAICPSVVCLVCGGGSSTWPPTLSLHCALKHSPGHVHRLGEASHTLLLGSRWCWGPRGTLEDASHSMPALVLSTADVWGQW